MKMPKKPLFKKTERVYMILIAIGLFLIGSGSLFSSFEADSRLFEFGGGVGSALIIFGSVGIFLIRKNPKSAKHQEIEEHDERNIRIREKSAYTAFFITIITLAAAVVVCVVLNNITACIIINIFMAVHVLSYLVLLRINNNKM